MRYFREWFSDHDIDHSENADEAIVALGSVKYDIIFFNEVLEHLFIEPSQVINSLLSSLNKGGYLFLQTPNYRSLKNKIK